MTYHIRVAELVQIRVNRYQTVRATQFMCSAQLDSDYSSLVPRMSSSHKPWPFDSTAVCRSAARGNFRRRQASHVFNPTALGSPLSAAALIIRTRSAATGSASGALPVITTLRLD